MAGSDTTYAAVAAANAALVRKATNGGVWIAPYSTAFPARTELFSATTGAFQGFPTGWKDLGKLTDDGMQMGRDTTDSTVTSFGSNSPTRIDVTADTSTLQISPQETNQMTIAMYFGVDPAALEPTDAGGSISWDKPDTPPIRYWRIITAAVDFDGDGNEILFGRIFPRMNVTTFADQTFDKSDNPVMYGVTMTAQMDDAAGCSERPYYGGAGWAGALSDMGLTPFVGG